MPLPVRVDPLGRLHAVPDRGFAFGNRGILHDADGRIVKGWNLPAWLICRTEFKGRRRDVLPPRGFTGLFFRDEATALAAGHRPCFECRRTDAVAYAEAVGEGLGTARPSAPELDRRLHAERLRPQSRRRASVGGSRLLHEHDDPASLPVGAIVVDGDGALLVRAVDGWRAWSFGALGDVLDGPPVAAHLVTPPTSVAALAAGYVPTAHPLVA